MQDRNAVLFANEAFYLAFRQRDYHAMEDLWSQREGIACIHPGWQALIGRDPVLQSWRSILENEGSPSVTCRQPQVLWQGDCALVVCYEQVGGALLVASNLFAWEEGGWRLVLHQAGPCPLAPEALESEEQSKTLQ